MGLTAIIEHNSLTQIRNTGTISEISDLPSELFNPFRFLILKDLKKNKFVSFTNLKETSGIRSDGNLVSHLRYLEQHEFIDVHKAFAGRYPKRFYFLTPKGEAVVEKLVTVLSNYIKQFE